jgi:MFS family permease
MGELKSSVYTSYVVALLFLANMANYGQRMILSILLPSIKADVHLTDAQLGLLMGGGFALTYAITGVPLARWADRHGRVRWLAIAIAFWSLATGLFGVTRSFIQMLLARVALGTGESICIPTSHSLLADYVSAENRPFALGVHSTGAVVGATLASIAGGYLAIRLGWRQTLALAALSGIALAVLIGATMREPRQVAHGMLTSQPSLRAVVTHLSSLRSYVLLLVAVCFGMLVEYGLNQWLPSYYVRQFSLSVSEVGFRYGLTVAIGGIPGSFLGGWLATRLHRGDLRWLAWFPTIMYSIALPVGLSMLLVSQASTALLLNGLYSFAIFATNGALWGACFVHVPPPMRATTSAITLLIAGITGLSLGPALVGGISDFLDARATPNSLQFSLVMVETLAIGVIVPLMVASRFIARERATARSSTGLALRGEESA